MQFFDALTLDAPRRTKDGYLAVRAKAARTGVYEYAGREVDPENEHGLRDRDTVHILRDDSAVFDNASARSFIGKPITDDHPANPVTSANWRDHARGTVMGAMRDGDYLAFDLLLTDADAIKKVDGGKRELSNGYSTDLEFGDFTAPDGTKCQARQTSIAGNHVALVDRGRAGSNCAIKDGFAACDAITADLMDRLTSIGDLPMKTLTIDGLRVPNVSDEAEAAIVKLQADKAAADAKVVAAEAKTVADAATIVAKDAEIADLTAKLADAAITPAKLADAAKEYADVQAKAKALGVTIAADADTAAIKKAVVDAKMGDKAKDYSVEHIGIAFDSLTADVKVEDAPANGVQPIGAPKIVGDAASGIAAARRNWLADKQNAFRAAAGA